MKCRMGQHSWSVAGALVVGALCLMWLMARPARHGEDYHTRRAAEEQLRLIYDGITQQLAVDGVDVVEAIRGLNGLLDRPVLRFQYVPTNAVVRINNATHEWLRRGGEDITVVAYWPSCIFPALNEVSNIVCITAERRIIYMKSEPSWGSAAGMQEDRSAEGW